MTVLVKTRSIAESDKPKWKESLVMSLMSSEDSDDEGCFCVRPLSWRSEKATEFFYTLDKKHEKKQSVKSKKMRINGLNSDRPRPLVDSVPAWCLK